MCKHRVRINRVTSNESDTDSSSNSRVDRQCRECRKKEKQVDFESKKPRQHYEIQFKASSKQVQGEFKESKHKTTRVSNRQRKGAISKCGHSASTRAGDKFKASSRRVGVQVQGALPLSGLAY